MSSDLHDLYDPLETGPRLPDPGGYDNSVPGDLVLLYPDGMRPRVIIRTPTERPDWIAIAPEYEWSTSAGPPTTIQYAGTYYEIIDIEKRGSYFEYWLMPSRENQILNRIVTYGAESELLRKENAAKEKLRRRVGKLVSLLSPIIGALPGDLQVRAAYRFGISLELIVGSSALAEVIFASYMIFVGRILSWFGTLVEAREVSYIPGSILGISSQVWMFIAPFLLLDAIIRWRSFRRKGRPYGLFPIEVLWRMMA